MFAKVLSLGIYGLGGFIVTAEVDISGGLPQFAVVGLPDNAVKEATDRVRSALKNLGYTYPASRITVNLAPADRRKTGPVYDLALLLGLLAASEQIDPLPQDCAFIGELSLDGAVRPVSGVLPMALECEKAGIKKLFLPRENVQEAAIVQGLEVFPLTTAKDVVLHFSGEKVIQKAAKVELNLGAAALLCPDFADVRGQLEARRAMEIAAAGQHNIVLVGAPGTGKSMLAKRLPSIMPPISYAEAIETSKIYSVSGVFASGGDAFVTTRPFRAPHHSISAAGLAGGGGIPRPGEISLAHNGVLFLDELAEFPRDVLEILRQPMEDGTVSLSRALGSATFPSRFMLVAAMNPCPCGFFGHPTRACRCVPQTVEKYLQKISGPLLDRIDLHVEVQPVQFDQLASEKQGEASSEILKRVVAAREFQKSRFELSDSLFVPNAHLAGKALRKYCEATPQAMQLLKTAFEKMGLSARGYDRVLRVARTIADFEASEIIDTQHIAEAVQYRNLDRKYWYTR